VCSFVGLHAFEKNATTRASRISRRVKRHGGDRVSPESER
jgi:hypothetical protein